MTLFPLEESVEIPLATATDDGLMSASDKAKLDSITSSGGTGIELRDEGVVVATAIGSLNFVGSGVAASADGTVFITGTAGPVGPAGPAGPAGTPGDTPLVIMNEGGTLVGPSIIVTGGVAFTLLATTNIQNIENETPTSLSISPPPGYTFRSGSSPTILANSRGVFQLIATINQVKRVA